MARRRHIEPAVSFDGADLLFMSSRAAAGAPITFTGRSITELLELSTEPGRGTSDIWRVSAEVIERLRS